MTGFVAPLPDAAARTPVRTPAGLAGPPLAAHRVVAAWMLGEVDRDGLLWQCDAVEGLRARFGDSYVYENAHGHLAIDSDVLAAFRELTADRVVWSRGGKFWRLRDRDDEPGRGQR